jgi:hypothetical protein
MDHVHVVLDSDLDDLVASQVSPNGRVLATGADLVGLVSLLPVHAEAVLMTVDCDCVERQLVGCAEDADGDFAAVGDWRLSDNVGSFTRAIGRGQRTQQLLQLHNGAARSQVMVHRVAVGMVLAMAVVELVLVNGRRGALISYKLGHAGRPLCAG